MNTSAPFSLDDETETYVDLQRKISIIKFKGQSSRALDNVVNVMLSHCHCQELVHVVVHADVLPRRRWLLPRALAECTINMTPAIILTGRPSPLRVFLRTNGVGQGIGLIISVHSRRIYNSTYAAS